ncbi:hypothetical protein CsSME_00046075 [Camellia sinensis var. sinensis]
MSFLTVFIAITLPRRDRTVFFRAWYLGHRLRKHGSIRPVLSGTRCIISWHRLWESFYSACQLCSLWMVTTRSMASHHNVAYHQADPPNPNNPPQYFTELTNSINRLAKQNQALINALLQRGLPIPPPPPQDIPPNQERAPSHPIRQPYQLNLEGLRPPPPDMNPPPRAPQPSVQAPTPEGEASSVHPSLHSGGDNIPLWDAELRAMKLQLQGVMQNIQNKPYTTTNSPFVASIRDKPLPPKLKMPSLDYFDGTTDPIDHLETYRTLMILHAFSDEIMCRAFPVTLKGSARL